MKRYVLTAIFAFSLTITASAQRLRVGEQSSGMVKVTGRVIDLQNKPVSDVIVPPATVAVQLATIAAFR